MTIFVMVVGSASLAVTSIAVVFTETLDSKTGIFG